MLKSICYTINIACAIVSTSYFYATMLKYKVIFSRNAAVTALYVGAFGSM
jgi:hypothetical protein